MVSGATAYTSLTPSTHWAGGAVSRCVPPWALSSTYPYPSSPSRAAPSSITPSMSFAMDPPSTYSFGAPAASTSDYSTGADGATTSFAAPSSITDGASITETSATPRGLLCPQMIDTIREMAPEDDTLLRDFFESYTTTGPMAAMRHMGKPNVASRLASLMAQATLPQPFTPDRAGTGSSGWCR